MRILMMRQASKAYQLDPVRPPMTVADTQLRPIPTGIAPTLMPRRARSVGILPALLCVTDLQQYWLEALHDPPWLVGIAVAKAARVAVTMTANLGNIFESEVAMRGLVVG